MFSAENDSSASLGKICQPNDMTAGTWKYILRVDNVWMRCYGESDFFRNLTRQGCFERLARVNSTARNVPTGQGIWVQAAIALDKQELAVIIAYERFDANLQREIFIHITIVNYCCFEAAAIIREK